MRIIRAAAILSFGGSQRSFVRPSGSSSFPQHVRRNTYNGCPVGRASCFSIESHHNIGTLIPGLLGRRSPTAIEFIVRTIDIDSFNTVFRRRSSPHVSKKQFEAILPTITHCDSTATVPGEGWLRGIQASYFDSVPSDVFGRSTGRGRFPMSPTCARLATVDPPANQFARWTGTESLPASSAWAINAACFAGVRAGDAAVFAARSKVSSFYLENDLAHQAGHGRLGLHRVSPVLGVRPRAVSPAPGSLHVNFTIPTHGGVSA